MERPYPASAGPDGFPGDEPMVSEVSAQALCPAPFTIGPDGVTIYDRAGQMFAHAATVDLNEPIKWPLARRNAVRLCSALNGVESRQNAVYAAHADGAQKTLYRMATALEQAYGGVPVLSDIHDHHAQCVLCLAEADTKAALVHTDECPFEDLSEAVAKEREGRGWNL